MGRPAASPLRIMQKQSIFRSKLLPYALVAPQLAVVLIFFYWPAAQAVIQSFLLQDAFGLSTSFVWFDNYRDLFSQPDYFAAIVRTFFFSVCDRGARRCPSRCCSPSWPTSRCAASTLYRTLLDLALCGRPARRRRALAVHVPSLARHVSRGSARRRHRLESAAQRQPGAALIILAAAWKQISYNFLFFLAGLQAIPRSVIEAAAIDGAGPMRRFWTMIFPLLSPTTFFLLVVNIVYAFFDTFGIIDTMTRGGPGKATEMLVYKVYSDGLLGGNLGSSAAQSVILMVIVIVLTAIQFRFVERKVTY